MLLLEIQFKDSHGDFDNENQVILINLENMEITGNENGEDVWSKVVDTATYTLIYDGGQTEISNDYVPNCIPNEYGDYLDLCVMSGKITNWESTLEEIEEEFEKKGKEV